MNAASFEIIYRVEQKMSYNGSAYAFCAKFCIFLAFDITASLSI